MNRFAARFFLFLFLSLLASAAWAQAPSPRVENTAARADTGK
jgi:hypothetical protein